MSRRSATLALGLLLAAVTAGAVSAMPSRSASGEPVTGSVEADAVAPTLCIFAARATKLHGTAAAYRLRVTLALSDGDDSHAVTYTIKVLNGQKTLAAGAGTSASGSAGATLALNAPSPRPRNVQLEVVASDLAGNETTQTRVVLLPR